MNTEVALTPNTVAILRSFVREGFTGKASIERLLQANPDEFCRAAVCMPAGAESSAGYGYLVHLLPEHGFLIRVLADTEIGSPVEGELEERRSAILQQPPSSVITNRTDLPVDVDAQSTPAQGSDQALVPAH